MKKLFCVLLGLLLLSLQVYAAPTKIDTLSYAIGYQLGVGLNHNKFPLKQQSFLKGLHAGFSGTKPAVSHAKMAAAMKKFQSHLITTKKEKLQKMSEANLKAGEEFLAKNKTETGVVTLDNGLQYKIMTPGTGAKPTATSSVTVDYEGTLIDGTVFDSSYKRGQPATFKVNQVIGGWTQALQLMKEGATWMLYIPANLAYGSHSMGPIQANSTLIFKVHLIKVD